MRGLVRITRNNHLSSCDLETICHYVCMVYFSADSHVQALLSFGSLVLGAIAHDSVAVRQVEVECDQRAVLQAQCPQGGAVNLGGGKRRKRSHTSCKANFTNFLKMTIFFFKAAEYSSGKTLIIRQKSAILNNTAVPLYI